MKKNFLFGIVSCFFLTVPGYCQLQKGTKYYAATISFDGSANKTIDERNPGKGNAFHFRPSLQAGKFINDNTLVGLGLGTSLNFYWENSGVDAQSYKYSSHANYYSLAPYFRKYKSLSPKWAVFLNSSAYFMLIGIKSKGPDNSKTSDTGFATGVGIVPGISYWISPRFALESDINLLSFNIGYQKLGTTENFNVTSMVTSNLNSYFSIRASWYLQKP